MDNIQSDIINFMIFIYHLLSNKAPFVLNTVWMLYYKDPILQQWTWQQLGIGWMMKSAPVWLKQGSHLKNIISFFR